MDQLILGALPAVEDGGKLTVVDTGFAGHYRLFRKGLEEMGRSVDDVEAILITHAHADHTGFAPRLAKETGAPIYLHGDDATLARRRRTPLPGHGHPWVGDASEAIEGTVRASSKNKRRQAS